MTQNTLRIEKTKQLISTVIPLSTLQWFLVLFFSCVLFLSLGLGEQHTTIFGLTGIFAFILLMFTLTALIQLRSNKKNYDSMIVVSWGEVLFYLLPLLTSTTFVLLSFWPGNSAYDGSLQWHEAISRGELNPLLGITATLFMRLFTYVSTSPAGIIIFQSIFSALGVALILKELRYKGVPRWVAQSCSLLIAFTPQYPMFFTNLGKDALSAVGIIFLSWSLLYVSRNIKAHQLSHLGLVILLFSAVFSGVIRVNTLPSVVTIVLLMMGYIFFKGHRALALIYGIFFLLTVIFLPKIAYFLSDEHQSKPPMSEEEQTNANNYHLPLGGFANYYIYQLFSAAVNSGIPIHPADEELFYRIAPRSAWTNYSCFMVDTTLSNVLKERLLTGNEFPLFLAEHQLRSSCLFI